MEAVFVGALVNPILTKLYSFAFEEIGISSSVQQDLDNLKSNVKLISAYLRDAEKGPISKRESINDWIQMMTSAIYDADDLLEEFNYQILSKQRNSGNFIKKTVNKLSTSNPIKSIISGKARKIKHINTKLGFVAKRGADLGLTQVALLQDVGESSQQQYHSRQTHPFGDVSKILGREAEKSKAIDMLLQSSSVVAIIGLGGLGKTTLATLIYKDTQINVNFDERIWVCVSTDFNVTTILKQMAVNLGINIEEMSIFSLVKDLNKKLSTKKYLLVLDDVWNTESEKWDDLKKCLFEIGASKESKILVTTRSGEVAKCMHCHSSFQLAGLSENDSWSLFREKAFWEGGAKETAAVTTTGKRIVERCKGVPLAILTLGGLLSTKSENEWSSIEKSDLWDLTSNETSIMSALRLSYDHFPSSYLKQCFAYCSIFPKDSILEKDNLIQLWIAQGFIQSTPGSSVMLEDTGNDYFNILVWNSFFEDVKVDEYERIQICKMHDLVHDLAQSIYKSECLVLDNINDSLSVRHLHLLQKEETHSKIPNGDKLRTLFLSCEMWGNTFAKLKCLRVLNLEGADFITELPKSIGKLKSLRYLNVSNTGIKELPTSILKLYSLQTIRFMSCEYFEHLPEHLGSMISLTHLCFDNDYAKKWKQMPFELGRLTSLQTLPCFVVACQKGHTIGELGSLERLKGELCIQHLELVRDRNEAESAKLLSKTNLFNLILGWSYDEDVNMDEDVIMDEDVLEGLQLPPNLESLTIKGFNGKKFPTWKLTTNVSISILPDSLVEIRLSNCAKCERVPTLGELPFLKVVEISKMCNLKTIGRELYSDKESCITLFPSLQTLTLNGLSNLVEWTDCMEPVVAFPRLEELSIKDCHELKTVPTHFPFLKRLEVENVKSGEVIRKICSRQVTTLTRLEIRGVLELRYLPKEVLQLNTNLTHIDIRECELLECIGVDDDVGLQNLMSLQQLSIWGCRKVSHIGSMHGLTSLIKLEIYGSNEIRDLPFGLGSCTSLKELWISGCTGLESVPSLENLSSLDSFFILGCPKLWHIGSMSGLTSLTRLSIICCDEMANLPNGLGSCTSLERLSVINCGSLGEDGGLREVQLSLHHLEDLNMGGLHPELESFPLNLSPQTLSCLKTLRLIGWPKLKSIPQQIQHLTALEQLWIHKFSGLEDLPNWLENLSSLRNLQIEECENLKYLPSMRRLTNLTYLDISRCPALSERRNKESGPEWSNISHIPHISFKF